LVHVSPAVISIRGSLSSAGTFSHGSNKLILNGDLNGMGHQVLTQLTPVNLYDLEIANSGNGVMLFQNVNITHNLQLTDGLLFSSETTPDVAVHFADNATTTGGSDSTFIDAFVEKTGDDAFTFPVGKVPERYRPLTISAPATVSTVVQTRYVFESYGNTTSVEAPLLSVSQIEYWGLVRTGSADFFTATIAWDNASESGLVDCNDISMAVWNGSQWSLVPSITTGQCGGANAGTLSSGANLPLIGPITIGFTNNVYQQAIELCAGDSVTIDTNTYSESGIYTDLFQDQNGNDSTVITILTVHEPLSILVNNNISYLQVVAEVYDSYQWVDCSNGYALIPGATTNSFHPTANGSYAAIVTKNGCTDTSSCYVISQLGTEENALLNVTVYPNPANDAISILFNAPEAEIIVTDTHGKIVRTQTVKSNDSVSIGDLKNGVYFLQITTTAGKMVERIVKQ